MKRKFLHRYQQALLAWLKQGRQENLQSARGLGQQALAVGLDFMALARFHEEILVSQVMACRRESRRAGIIRQAGIFFSEAITPLADAHRGRAAAVHLNKIVEMLSQRTVELAAANIALQLEIVQRQAVEEALKKSERHYSRLLEESDRLQQQLRQLSRQILQAQEEERREISRELHDVIAQTLTGINVRLAALARAASINTKDLDQNIAKTQKLVEKSVDIVHRFARELRPAVLDDLGLIPALHSFLKNFTARTGVRTHLTAFARVEDLDMARRTVLFRVAQEALTNVGRHAKASRVEVLLQKLPAAVRLEVKDDGKSFSVDRTLHASDGKHLGLLGMRERVEMVGGTFGVESTPGRGTTIRVEVPFAPGRKSALKKSGNDSLKCS
jgi:signal transduction histidine kinase